MSLKITQSPAAIADVLEIAEYLAQQADLNTSDRFLGAASQTFRQLADMPGIGVRCGYNNPRLADMRRFPVSGFANYLVFYQVTEMELRVLRVLHGSQDIAQIFRPSDEG